MWLVRLRMRVALPCPGPEALQGRALICEYFRHIKVVGGKAEVVLRICYGGVQELQHGLGCSLGGVHQYALCFVYALTADQVDNGLDLAGGDSYIAGYCMGTLVGVCLAGRAIFS